MIEKLDRLRSTMAVNVLIDIRVSKPSGDFPHSSHLNARTLHSFMPTASFSIRISLPSDIS